MKQIPGTIITKLKNKASNFMQDILLFLGWSIQRIKHPWHKVAVKKTRTELRWICWQPPTKKKIYKSKFWKLQFPSDIIEKG